ncbi:transmembrane protein, putative [Medicago truncatula]|uniref:Transmembrane protein, putative n=1 Tax=Medicago truncatula TaxID=3880 RepID=A0A072UF66_MEDTR|nr:transmembrane protein, putative [Medicago truncatula]
MGSSDDDQPHPPKLHKAFKLHHPPPPNHSTSKMSNFQFQQFNLTLQKKYIVAILVLLVLFLLISIPNLLVPLLHRLIHL